VQSAWRLLHDDVPRLFEKARFDFHGKLRPGQTIQADIVREDVGVTVSFEVFRKGTISFMYERIPNMVSWTDIHSHYAAIDRRIGPFGCDINEENRPDYPNTLLEFRLDGKVEVPDTLGEDGGVPGRTNAAKYSHR
jgi:hypothetical protein